MRVDDFTSEVAKEYGADVATLVNMIYMIAYQEGSEDYETKKYCKSCGWDLIYTYNQVYCNCGCKSSTRDRQISKQMRSLLKLNHKGR